MTVIILSKYFLLTSTWEAELYASRYSNELVHQNENRFSFKMEDGSYVFQDGVALHGDRDKKSEFELITLKNNLFAIRGVNGKFLRTYNPVKSFDKFTGVNFCMAYVDKNIIDEECHFKIDEPYYQKEIIRLDYDLKNAVSKPGNPIVAGVHKVEPKGYTEEATITFRYTKSEVGTWNNSIGKELSMTTGFEAGVPSIASTKFELSVSVNQQREWGGSKGKEITVEGSSKITVPPNKRGIIKFMVSQAVLTVPFTYVTKTWYNDGKVIEKSEAGKYVNVESYNIYTTNEELHGV
ncbi:hypothetical protein BJ944DRAFT_227301 [Cunninghamella echinulata]|nr:hypothetical protein BJ944DRAFT_227301 [Cunninghamella echinulata]